MRVNSFVVSVTLWVTLTACQSTDLSPNAADAGSSRGDVSAWTVGGDTSGSSRDTSGSSRDTGGSSRSDKLDMLWVIDNTTSMCEEQRAVRKHFGKFLQPLVDDSVDLRLAVTTTHFQDTVFEKVAEPGRIQSTPHPPVGFGKACQFEGRNKDGERDYTPLVRQIRTAVQCTETPGNFPRLRKLGDANVTARDKRIFRCALVDDEPAPGGRDEHSYCEDIGKPDAFSKEQLFPCGRKYGDVCSKSQLRDVYRDIPKILKTSDYRTSRGGVDVNAMERDFACMSLVGTRGSSPEQGLNALKKAVSPAMTGGPVEEPEDPNAPNHGLIRRDATFMATFVTDENDCSHSGSAIRRNKQQNACGQLNCYFPTKQTPQDPLTATSDLYSDVTANLKNSKKRSNLDESNLLLASLHGTYRRYADSIPNSCSPDRREQLNSSIEVCATSRGTVRSGDRYADFIANAPDHFPSSKDTGLMCRPSLGEPMRRLGEFAR